MADDQYIGYLKYSGHSVNDGCLDARKAANALIGFDESLRFFIEDDFLIKREIELFSGSGI